jgi:hypothetical protein
MLLTTMFVTSPVNVHVLILTLPTAVRRCVDASRHAARDHVCHTTLHRA